MTQKFIVTLGIASLIVFSCVNCAKAQMCCGGQSIPMPVPYQALSYPIVQPTFVQSYPVLAAPFNQAPVAVYPMSSNANLASSMSLSASSTWTSMPVTLGPNWTFAPQNSRFLWGQLDQMMLSQCTNTSCYRDCRRSGNSRSYCRGQCCLASSPFSFVADPRFPR